MNIYYKKKLTLLAVIFLLSSAGFSQIQIGSYGINQYAFGNYAEYALCTAGGGLAGNFDMPLPFSHNFGISAKIQGNAVIPATDNISSYWNFAVCAGVYIRLPFGTSGFGFQPEVSYGILMHVIDVAKGIQNSPNGIYADQIVQFAGAFRYNPPDLAGGNIEFELAPLYTLLCEQDSVLQSAGVRIGVLYKIDKKNKNQSTEEILVKAKQDETHKKIIELALTDVSVKQSSYGLMISLEQIQFEPNSSELNEYEKEKLEKIGILLKEIPKELHIIGYCADIGNAAEQKLFSRERAIAVADYFVSSGIKKENQITTEGRGSDGQEISDDIQSARSKMRRVEIIIIE